MGAFRRRWLNCTGRSRLLISSTDEATGPTAEIGVTCRGKRVGVNYGHSQIGTGAEAKALTGSAHPARCFLGQRRDVPCGSHCDSPLLVDTGRIERILPGGHYEQKANRKAGTSSAYLYRRFQAWGRQPCCRRGLFVSACCPVGVCSKCVREWHQKYAPEPEATTEQSIVQQLQQENKRLRKALEQAELERNILKKATAYFAKESQ